MIWKRKRKSETELNFSNIVAKQNSGIFSVPRNDSERIP